MPELPELEVAWLALEEHCVGKRIVKCSVFIDGVSLSDLQSALVGNTILAALRKGKNPWLRLDSSPFPTFQFGEPDNQEMSNMHRFLFRWLIPCFGGEPGNPETSIQGSSGNIFSQYYWQKRLASHLYGQFSMAVAQANLQNEDRSQLVSGSLTDDDNGPRGVFVGIYDGHGGSTCSQFVLDHLFQNMKSAITNHNGVNPEAIQEAYQTTEETFVDYVRNNWHNKPRLALLGSCCLVGVVCNNVLYVANAGDSRAVLARWPNGGNLEVIQLSVDYNARDRERRDEVCVEHPPGTSIFTEVVRGYFYVKGSLQVTRAIGDVYLKYNEFNQAPLPSQYIEEDPIVRPILKAEPTIQTHQLGPDDRFVIFASDGLWDEMTNEEAATVVQNSPRAGAAAMLMREVLDKVARRHGMEYLDLRSFKPGYKRRYHDDMSIAILFFDNMQAPAPS